MDTKWIFGLAFFSVSVIDVTLIVWLFSNFRDLFVVGPLLLIFWLVSFILGIFSRSNLKKYNFKLENTPEGNQKAKKFLRLVVCLSLFIANVFTLLTIQILDLVEHYPETGLYTVILSIGILFSPTTFNGLGMMITSLKMKRTEISDLSLESHSDSYE
ncbi:MAG: hypothetical protein ACTSUO_09045 [Candidatus Thorarchaeota archaeon]